MSHIIMLFLSWYNVLTPDLPIGYQHDNIYPQYLCDSDFMYTSKL